MLQAHESTRRAAESRPVSQTENRLPATLTTRRVDELRRHSAYALLGLKVPTYKLNEVIEQGEDAFLTPLTVTSDGIIIDGYALWEVAMLQRRSTVECIEYDLSEPEALYRLLLSHRLSPGLATINRILLALRLENHLRQTARQNQQVGGQSKGLSKLPEAARANVRKQMARAAGVSGGTFHYATQLLRTAHPGILQALRDGEIKIYRAWKWSKEPQPVQKELLETHRRNRGMMKVAEKLVAKHVKRYHVSRVSKPLQQDVSAGETVRRLGSLAPDLLRSVTVIYIKAPGKILALSHDIARELGFMEEPSS